MARSPFLQITIYAIDSWQWCLFGRLLEGFTNRSHTWAMLPCQARATLLGHGFRRWRVALMSSDRCWEARRFIWVLNTEWLWLALSIDIFQCRHPKTPLIFPELPKSHLKAAWTWWWALAISCSLAHDRMGWVRDCHKRGVLSNRDIIRDDQEMISMSPVSYIVTMRRKQREQRESGFPKRHHFVHLSLHTSDVSKALQLRCDFAGAHRLWVWRLHACGYTLWGVNCVHRSLTRNAMCQNM